MSWLQQPYPHPYNITTEIGRGRDFFLSLRASTESSFAVAPPSYTSSSAKDTFRDPQPMWLVGCHVFGVVRVCQWTVLSPLLSEIFESPGGFFGVEAGLDSTGQSFKYTGDLISIRDELSGWISAPTLFSSACCLVHITCLFCFHSFFSLSWLILPWKFNLTIILEYTVCQAVFHSSVENRLQKTKHNAKK